MDEEGGLQHGVDFNDLQIDRDRRAVMKRHDIDRKVESISIHLQYIEILSQLIEMWSEALVKVSERVYLTWSTACT